MEKTSRATSSAAAAGSAVQVAKRELAAPSFKPSTSTGEPTTVQEQAPTALEKSTATATETDTDTATDADVATDTRTVMALGTGISTATDSPQVVSCTDHASAVSAAPTAESTVVSGSEVLGEGGCQVKPLQSFEAIARDAHAYIGPTDESNWVRTLAQQASREAALSLWAPSSVFVISPCAAAPAGRARQSAGGCLPVVAGRC